MKTQGLYDDAASNIADPVINKKTAKTIFRAIKWPTLRRWFCALDKRADVAITLEDRPPDSARWIIVLVVSCLVIFVTWAWLSEIDEVTRGEGRVIPSGKVQVIQSSVPGSISEILVEPGQLVSKGTILVRLDDTSISVNLGEQVARSRILKAQIQRLKQEHVETTDQYICPEEIALNAPDICKSQASLLNMKIGNLHMKVRVLLERVEQRQRALNEVQSNKISINEALSLAQSELKLLAPLVQRKVISRMDLIQAQRAVSGLKGELRAIVQSIASKEAALREILLQVDEQKQLFYQAALDEMTSKSAELSIVTETIRGAVDRVERTDIRSPVDGIINKLEINTNGAVVPIGARIMDIVPLNDRLLIEAKISPKDIAFIRPGLPVNIKITAYDFSIFGGLDGQVKNISADSIYDEKTGTTYYSVVVESVNNTLDRKGESYPILPGMVSQIDILTGQKSILHYLLQPVSKVRQEALRER